MNNRMKRTKSIANDNDLGVSFSINTCREYGIEWQDCLSDLLSLGIKRFRIMSYWDLHETEPGQYDFKLLDEQIKIISKTGSSVSLCIGMRQPRWPETHLPAWAKTMTGSAREEAYLKFHEKVIGRYKDQKNIESWQLENEFWNRGFGLNNDFSRKRLIKEFGMLREHDPNRPIIMSLGNTYGYPIGRPKADLYATTIYLQQYKNNRYTKTKYPSYYFGFRKHLLKLLVRRELIIHELQAEPWGPQANYKMSDAEQCISMNAELLSQSVEYARKTGIKYIDLWGAEWWYWRKMKFNDPGPWNIISKALAE